MLRPWHLVTGTVLTILVPVIQNLLETVARVGQSL